MCRRRARLAVKRAYETTAFQILIAIAIFVNFLCNAVEAELLVSAYELCACSICHCPNALRSDSHEHGEHEKKQDKCVFVLDTSF